MLEDDKKYMQLALNLAEKGRFSVSPNPMVGCVLVKDGQIVGSGFHRFPGGPHAEIYAIKEAQDQAFGATLYLTLEPCCHFGKTPPCTDAILKAGIKKVVVACKDPNPIVSGSGIDILQQRGIAVEVGLLRKEAKDLNTIFFHYITTKRPYVFAKWAMSLDGQTAVNRGDEKQISDLESVKAAHLLRQQVDGIIIGANTALEDNPLLTVRYIDPILRHPTRFVLCSNKTLPLDLKLFDPELPAKTILVVTEDAEPKFLENAKHKGIEIWRLQKNEQGKVNLNHFLEHLGEKKYTSILVEGGMTLLRDFFKENLINKVDLFLAPVIIGSLDKKMRLKKMKSTYTGSDLHIEIERKNNE